MENNSCSLENIAYNLIQEDVKRHWCRKSVLSNIIHRIHTICPNMYMELVDTPEGTEYQNNKFIINHDGWMFDLIIDDSYNEGSYLVHINGYHKWFTDNAIECTIKVTKHTFSTNSIDDKLYDIYGFIKDIYISNIGSIIKYYWTNDDGNIVLWFIKQWFKHKVFLKSS